MKLLEGSLVLHGHQRASADRGVGVQHAHFLMGEKLFQHTRHGSRNRQPLVNEEEVVYPHTDEEDDEVAFDLRGKAAVVNDGRRTRSFSKHVPIVMLPPWNARAFFFGLGKSGVGFSWCWA